MNKFLNQINKDMKGTYTQNGMYAHNTTDSKVLDLFAKIGSMRNQSEEEIRTAFIESYKESPSLTLKMLFYARDIRGGLGERRVFRIMLKELALIDYEIVSKLIEIIPFYGRYDDMLVLLDDSINLKLQEVVVEFLYNKVTDDIESIDAGDNTISLVSKWLPSINSKNKEQRKKALILANAWGWTEKQYRKNIVKCRKVLNLPESNLSQNTIERVVYPNVPSNAMLKYKSAFYRRDFDRFSDYIDQVSKGTSKINAGTLYPYDLVSEYGFPVHGKLHPVVEAQWNLQPFYVDSGVNAVVMADTSGSMYGRPVHTALGLAIYFAQRNVGDFKNLFMTFSSSPSWVKVSERGLFNNLKKVPKIISSTNIYAGMKLILDTAIKSESSQKDLPKALIVVSDMEFDSYGCSGENLFDDTIKNMFEKHGYIAPQIIFWNVDSSEDKFHTHKDAKNITLVSGQSTSIFKNVLKSIGKTPYELMLTTLEEYDIILDILKI